MFLCETVQNENHGTKLKLYFFSSVGNSILAEVDVFRACLPAG